jgi:hypothetical protein
VFHCCADQNTNAGVAASYQVAPARLAENAERSAQAVGGQAIRSNNRYRDATGQSQPGTRVYDVRVAPTREGDVLFRVARRGHRPVCERDELFGRVCGQVRDFDAPARFVCRRTGNHDVAAGLDKGAINAVGAQHALSLVAGKALGDAPKSKRILGTSN